MPVPVFSEHRVLGYASCIARCGHVSWARYLPRYLLRSRGSKVSMTSASGRVMALEGALSLKKGYLWYPDGGLPLVG